MGEGWYDLDMADPIPMHRLAVAIGRNMERLRAWGPRFATDSIDRFIAWRNRPKVHRCRLCQKPLDDPTQLECEGDQESRECWAQTSW